MAWLSSGLHELAGGTTRAWAEVASTAATVVNPEASIVAKKKREGKNW